MNEDLKATAEFIYDVYKARELFRVSGIPEEHLAKVIAWALMSGLEGPVSSEALEGMEETFSNIFEFFTELESRDIEAADIIYITAVKLNDEIEEATKTMRVREQALRN